MKPGDFLLGVLDFFAVLLPGAIATWLVAQYTPASYGCFLLPGGGDDATVHWTVFLLASYVLGHFVFMAGSYLDPVYDQWRERAKPIDHDRAYRAADDIFQAVTPKLRRGSLTTLKWAKSYVQIHAAGARTEIDRIEANSKFFRGMVVVSAAFFVHFVLGDPSLVLAVAAVAVCALSFERFCDQRWKASELSYATAVIVYETKLRGGRPVGGSGDGSPSGD